MNARINKVLLKDSVLTDTSTQDTEQKQCPWISGDAIESKHCDMQDLQQYIPEGLSCGTGTLRCLRDIDGLWELYDEYSAAKHRGLLSRFDKRRTRDDAALKHRMAELEARIGDLIAHYFL